MRAGRRSSLLFVAALTLCWHVCSQAEEQQDASNPTNWGGEGEFGFAVTKGNTDTQNFNVGINLQQVLKQWENTYGFDSLNESQEDQSSAERYTVNLQSNRKVSESNFILGTVTYEDDRFSGFDYEATASLGIGRRLIDMDGMQLDVEVGPGHRTTKATTEDHARDESILRTAMKFRYDLSETARFVQTITSTAGDDRSVTKSDTALSAQIVGNLAMKVTFTVKYNSAPAEVENVKKDSGSAITLVYKF
ncbi:MAG: DUF481 domain-containing protein [Gammaproteobacteria bacterium]